jgi:hypothetical protein
MFGNPLEVEFKDKKDVPQGFRSNSTYKAYECDIIDDEETRLLLSDDQGNLKWVSMSKLKVPTYGRR